jgi:murein tripeptide amidase MpaA
MSKPELSFDRYYTYAELTEAMQQLAAAYPELAKLYSIGQSPEGRELWLMELTNPATGAADQKPGYYADGNHHAGEVTGSMAALHLIYRLLTGPEGQLLDKYAFYVLPRVSPDGAEAYLTTPETLRSAPRHYPFPDPQPGLHPADINGDGEILLMRVKSPIGEWKASQEDPRLMLKRLPDEDEGEFYRIFTEGYIEDYDGSPFAAQATHKWGLDLNRNYPCEWGLESRQPGAGDYPLSEPETRAVANFVLAHKNIASVVTFHTTGGVILRPPGTKPEKQAPKRDVAMFKAVGEMATEETGYPCCNIFDEFLQDTVNFSSGAFDDWLYEHQGIPAYTVELWDLATRAGVHVWPRRPKTEREEGEDYAKILAWIDQELNGEGFAPWTPFEHPQLGPVEIGGFHIKQVVQNCPPRFLPDECAKNVRFCLRQAKTMPRLTLSPVTVKKVDAATWQLSVTVTNAGYLPTFLTQVALNQKTAKPVTASLSAPQGVQVHGKSRQQIGHLEGRAGRAGVFANGSFRQGKELPSEQLVSWVVSGPAGSVVTVTAQSEKGGTVSAAVTLS